MELPNAMTVVGAEPLAICLYNAWQKLLGEFPERGAILTLLGFSAHETGRWKACHCWNLGNVKSKEGDGRDHTFFRCWEVEQGQTVWYNPPHPATRFRAFRTLTEGAVDYLGFLRGSRRYARAWPELALGNPVAFVQALKAGGYFTAPEGPVAASVSSLFREFDKRIAPFDTAPEPDIDDATRERTQALVALSLSELAAPFVVPEKPDPDDIA